MILLGKAGRKLGRFSEQNHVLRMWTSGRRKVLARYAAGYDALIVLGCDPAVETARSCIKSKDCRVIPGMEAEGIMNVIPNFQFPFNIWLEVSNVAKMCIPFLYN